MKKHLIVIGMTLVLLIVGLCGCVEETKTNDEGENIIDDTPKEKEDILLIL